jgi:NMD protein affecting ribosome stability and mRNA decay
MTVADSTQRNETDETTFSCAKCGKPINPDTLSDKAKKIKRGNMLCLDCLRKKQDKLVRLSDVRDALICIHTPRVQVEAVIGILNARAAQSSAK